LSFGVEDTKALFLAFDEGTFVYFFARL
jgi:hypothetical protein